MEGIERTGRLYENDIVTTLINALINDEQHNTAPKSVLVIDDLDQLVLTIHLEY